MTKPSVVTARTLEAQEIPGEAVVIDALHFEYWCQRIADMDMPTLDEGNFLTGALTTAVAMAVAIVGVALGTTNPSPWLYVVFGVLFATSLSLSWYFKVKYDQAKKQLKKAGKTLSDEMREIAAAQKRARTESAL